MSCMAYSPQWWSPSTISTLFAAAGNECTAQRQARGGCRRGKLLMPTLPQGCCNDSNTRFLLCRCCSAHDAYCVGQQTRARLFVPDHSNGSASMQAKMTVTNNPPDVVQYGVSASLTPVTRVVCSIYQQAHIMSAAGQTAPFSPEPLCLPGQQT